MQQNLTRNPLAPDVANGFNDVSPAGYVDAAFSYVYDVVLQALQALQNQSLVTTNDADFLWAATIISFATGAFNVRFADSTGYWISNSMVASANILGDPSSPDPLFPSLIIPAGGRIAIDITDTSNAVNTIQIRFVGLKRYRIG